MTLADGMARAQPQEVQRLMSALGLDARTLASLPRRDVVARLVAPERVGRVLAALGDDERAALRHIVVAWQGEVLTQWALGHLEAVLGDRGRATAACRDLAARGLLLPLSVRTGRYTVPDEVIPTLDAWLVGELRRESAVEPPAGAAFLPTPEPADAVGDLARLLGALQSGVAVTEAGHVYRREQQRLPAWLAPWPSRLPVAPGRSRRGGGLPFWDGFELRLGLLFALAAVFQLVEQRHQREEDAPASRRTLWATGPLASAWCALDPWVQWRGVFEAWRRLLFRAHPALPLVLRIPGGGGCVDIDRLRVWWSAQAPPDGFSDGRLDVEDVRFFLYTGWAIGALQVVTWGAVGAGGGGAAGGGGSGGSGGGAPAGVGIHLTAAAQAALGDGGPPEGWPAWEERFHVQGNFEVIAPPYLHPRVLARLAALAAPVRVDRAAVLRLQSGPVSAAVARGEPADRLLAFLEQGSASGTLPQNVAFTLRQWAAPPARVTLRPAVLLEVPDPATAARLKRIAAVRQMRARELTPGVWAFPADDGQRLWDALRRDGLQLDGSRSALARPEAPWRWRSAQGSGPVHMPWPGPHLDEDHLVPPGVAPQAWTDAEAAAARAPEDDAEEDPEEDPEDDPEHGLLRDIGDGLGGRPHGVHRPPADPSRPGTPRPVAIVPGEGSGGDGEEPLPEVPSLGRTVLRRVVRAAVRGGDGLVFRLEDGERFRFQPITLRKSTLTGFCFSCESIHDVDLDGDGLAGALAVPGGIALEPGLDGE